MKIEVTKTYKDKNTGELYVAGKFAEYEDARANEIISAGYARAVKEPEIKVEEPKEEVKVEKPKTAPKAKKKKK